jgi:protein-disulfide isomerase
LLGAGTIALAGALPPRAGHAGTMTDPRLAERAIGHADAPVTIAEYYSLTCPHCARFARDTLPRIQKDLIDTGRVRWVFKDYPLDQVALTAAMVARALPPERYEPFVNALLASQDRWAFARGVNSTDELAKMAALAGLPRPTFDATIKDEALRNAILQAQADDSKTFGIDSTPTFIINGPHAKDRHESGEKSFDEFARWVAEAAG